MIERPIWDRYFLNIAEQVAKRGTCIRRNYGAVITKGNIIIATGYTGAARGEPNCCDIGTCKRNDMNFPSGEGYDHCRSVHAEANAIIHCDYEKMKDSTLYLVGLDAQTGKIVNAFPCRMCWRNIINARIKDVVTLKDGKISLVWRDSNDEVIYEECDEDDFLAS